MLFAIGGKSAHDVNHLLRVWPDVQDEIRSPGRLVVEARDRMSRRCRERYDAFTLDPSRIIAVDLARDGVTDRHLPEALARRPAVRTCEDQMAGISWCFGATKGASGSHAIDKNPFP